MPCASGSMPRKLNCGWTRISSWPKTDAAVSSMFGCVMRLNMPAVVWLFWLTSDRVGGM